MKLKTMLFLMIMILVSACDKIPSIVWDKSEIVYKNGHGVTAINDTDFVFYETYSNGHISGGIYRVNKPENRSIGMNAMSGMSMFNSLNAHAKAAMLKDMQKSGVVEIENITNDQERLKQLING